MTGSVTAKIRDRYQKRLLYLGRNQIPFGHPKGLLRCDQRHFTWFGRENRVVIPPWRGACLPLLIEFQISLQNGCEVMPSCAFDGPNHSSLQFHSFSQPTVLSQGHRIRFDKLEIGRRLGVEEFLDELERSSPVANSPVRTGGEKPRQSQR